MAENEKDVAKIYNDPCSVPKHVKVGEHDWASNDVYKIIYYFTKKIEEKDDPFDRNYRAYELIKLGKYAKAEKDLS